MPTAITPTFFQIAAPPTEQFVWRFAQGITPQARANTAACKLEYTILDN